MSVVLCLPAHLCVSPQRPVASPPRERVSIDLENAASPEEADELEEMTADEMAVDGYYVVAGIARQEYKQGWKFLTLWDGYIYIYMGYLRRPGNLCQPSYNQTGVPTPSSAPTSLRTTRGSS